MAKTSKAYEIINELKYNPDFQGTVSALREMHSVPKGGFDCEEDFNTWEKNQEFLDDIYDSIVQLAIDYKIPSNMNEYLKEYIFYENEFEDQKYDEAVCELDSESGKGATVTTADMEWANGEVPFVKVFISDTASLTDAKQFLTKQWKNIQKQLTEQRGRPKTRIRRKINVKRDARIRELYKLNHDELGVSKGGMSKEIHIGKLILEEFGEQIDLVNIRKIGSYNPRS